MLRAEIDVGECVVVVPSSELRNEPAGTLKLGPVRPKPVSRDRQPGEHVGVIGSDVQGTWHLRTIHNRDDRSLRLVVYELGSAGTPLSDRLHCLANHLLLPGVSCAHVLSAIVGTKSASG